ncbi:MAG: hypothetical protein ACRYGP_13085 [Janthinobacterium lividum]
MDDHTALMRGLPSAITAFDELPHPRPAGRLLLAALAGKGANDDAVASLASMPVTVAREVTPTMLVRCQHVPTLLAAKTNRHLLGTTYSNIRITADGQRRSIRMRDRLIGE